MKCQDLFSLKNKKKNKKLSSAVVVIGTLRVNDTLLWNRIKNVLFSDERIF